MFKPKKNTNINTHKTGALENAKFRDQIAQAKAAHQAELDGKKARDATLEDERRKEAYEELNKLAGGGSAAAGARRGRGLVTLIAAEDSDDDDAKGQSNNNGNNVGPLVPANSANQVKHEPPKQKGLISREEQQDARRKIDQEQKERDDPMHEMMRLMEAKKQKAAQLQQSVAVHSQLQEEPQPLPQHSRHHPQPHKLPSLLPLPTPSSSSATARISSNNNAASQQTVPAPPTAPAAPRSTKLASRLALVSDSDDDDE